MMMDIIVSKIQLLKRSYLILLMVRIRFIRILRQDVSIFLNNMEKTGKTFLLRCTILLYYNDYVILVGVANQELRTDSCQVYT
jgi:hypothetical protein